METEHIQIGDLDFRLEPCQQFSDFWESDRKIRRKFRGETWQWAWDGRTVYKVFSHSDRLVGVISAMARDGCAVIDTLDIDHDYSMTNLGTALLEFLADILRGNGIGRLYMYTRDRDTWQTMCRLGMGRISKKECDAVRSLHPDYMVNTIGAEGYIMEVPSQFPKLDGAGLYCLDIHYDCLICKISATGSPQDGTDSEIVTRVSRQADPSDSIRIYWPDVVQNCSEYPKESLSAWYAEELAKSFLQLGIKAFTLIKDGAERVIETSGFSLAGYYDSRPPLLTRVDRQNAPALFCSLA